MAGGYLIEGGGGSSRLAVVDQPPTAYKHTTAGDMAALAAMLVDAAAGRGALLRHGVSPHELVDADNDVAVVFTHQGPLVVAIYSNGTEDLSVETFGEIAVSDLLTADNLG